MQSFTSQYPLEFLQHDRIYYKLRSGVFQQGKSVFQQPFWRSNLSLTTWKVSTNDVRKTKVHHQLIHNFPVQETGTANRKSTYLRFIFALTRNIMQLTHYIYTCAESSFTYSLQYDM